MNSLNFILESLPQFIMEMEADWCMVYDFVESQLYPATLTDEEWDKVGDVFIEITEETRY